MEGNWGELKEKINKEIEEAVQKLLSDTLQEVENIVNSIKAKAQELVKGFEEKVNEEYVKQIFEDSTKTLIEGKKGELNELIDKTLSPLREEIEKTKGQFQKTLDEELKKLEDSLSQHVREAIDAEKIKTILDERIRRFFEEETHIFEEELQKLSKEVLDKNQKDIKKNMEKALKNLYESEEGLKKIVLEAVKTQQDFMSEEIKEKIKEIVNTEAKNLLLQSPLAERIAEVVGVEMKKYMSEIENLKSALDVLEVKLKILSESPQAVTEGSEPPIPQVDLFPPDEGVKEEVVPAENLEIVEEAKVQEVVEEKPVEEEVPLEERAELKLETPITITYFGHASFLIEAKGVKILTDPYKHMALNNSIKYDPIDVEADFVTVSHPHMDQGAWKEIPGNPKLVEVEGDKTFEGYPFLKFKGIHTYHDNAEGNVRGHNMVFNIEISGVRLTHLGALGHILTNEQVKAIGKPVDILFIPVGGYDTLPVRDTLEVIEQLKPLIIIPMRFKTEACDLPLAEVDAFTSMVKYPVKTFDSIVNIEILPPSTEVWVLKPLKMPKF